MKKILSLVFVCAILAGSFVGCGKAEPEPEVKAPVAKPAPNPMEDLMKKIQK